MDELTNVKELSTLELEVINIWGGAKRLGINGLAW